jgi:glycyl-tRNA synthetase beta chain
MLDTSVATYKSTEIFLKDTVISELHSFLIDRFSFYLKDQRNLRYDIVQSVISFEEKLFASFLSASPTNSKTNEADVCNFLDLMERANAIQKYLNTENVGDFMALFIRASGIVGDFCDDTVLPELLKDPTEIKAFKELEATRADMLVDGRYTEKMQKIALLRKAFDDMFVAVQINTKEEDIRRNRLAILFRLIKYYDSISDFRKIQQQ